MTVRVGVMLPTFRDSPMDAIEVAVDAERVGLDGVFVYDHLWPMGSPERPALAPFPLLGTLAVLTDRISLGTLVARVGVVRDETLIAQFEALEHLAPGRVIAGIGTGDHLSFNENIAYGLSVDSALERRSAVGRCARAMLDLGLVVWVGGTARATIAVAEQAGAVPNLWQASPERLAEQAARSEVTWAGMAGPGASGEKMAAEDLAAVAEPLARAGASWLVFGWPLRVGELGAAAASVRR